MVYDMKVIGITGGIGSGKSLVAKILIEKHGAYFLNTDRIAKEQMEIGGISYAGVVDFFGNSILTEDKSIDRTKLSKIVFQDKEKLMKLNTLTHPNVLKAVEEELDSLRKAGKVPYVIIETALMIEAGYDFICDEVWYVYTPEEIRRERLKKERNYSDQKIDSIFENQRKEEEFRKKYPKVIENTGDIQKLCKQVERLLQEE
ncbi:MAG: dephospho-CoA kinase [Lachnospiraceae bacterium]|nr:dephospho-CoA kinase [Lachnospiraceae bacterium]